jgi:predicted dienelactone hydrolase
MVGYRHLTIKLASALAAAAALSGQAASAATLDLTLQDQARQRTIPVELSFPAAPCTTAPCPVALLSAGYGIGHKEYHFLVEELNRSGWLVVSVEHQLPTDAKLDRNGDLLAQMKPMRRRGVANLRFVQDTLSKSHPGYDWRHVTLIGHSLGGDISAERASEGDATITRLVTLDSRRAALPRSSAVKVLSIRAGDTQADPGVLPDAQEQKQYGTCIVKLPDAKHNEMYDGGGAELKAAINRITQAFLGKGTCEALPGFTGG